MKRLERDWINGLLPDLRATFLSAGCMKGPHARCCQVGHSRRIDPTARHDLDFTTGVLDHVADRCCALQSLVCTAGSQDTLKAKVCRRPNRAYGVGKVIHDTVKRPPKVRHAVIFTTAIDSSFESFMQTEMAAAIRKLISDEDVRKPLSDAKLCAQLKDQGMTVARRTIAKYREQLAIPPSNERKRLN